MMTQRAATDTGAAMVGAVAIRRSGEVSGARALNRNAYCAVRKIGDTPIGTAQSGGESEEGRRPAPLGGVRGEGRELAACLCKREGLPRERSSAGGGVAILPRCVV